MFVNLSEEFNSPLFILSSTVRIEITLIYLYYLICFKKIGIINKLTGTIRINRHVERMYNEMIILLIDAPMIRDVNNWAHKSRCMLYSASGVILSINFIKTLDLFKDNNDINIQNMIRMVTKWNIHSC